MSQQINILCLHGRQQTGTLFSRRISTLTKRAKQFDKDVTFSFFFIDAPFILPMKEGDTVNVRAWWNNDKDPEGYAKSVAMIDELWKKHSFDAVLGFSQGAAVGAALCVARYPSLKCAVLVSPPDSGDWIFDGVESIRARNATSKQNGKGLSKFANETISTLGSASASSSSLSPVQIMIVAGHNDKLVSVDSSKALGERCIARDSEKVLSYVVLEHELGHLVPTKFFDEIIQFISNNCARSFDAQISSGHAVAIKSEKKTNTSQKASSVQSESSAKTPLSSSSSLAASVPMKSSKPEKNQRIEKKIFTVTSQEIADMQREEIESLSAIFGDTDAPFTCNDKLPSKSGEAAPKIVLHLLKVSNLDSNESEKGILGKWKRAGLNLSLQLTSNYPLIEPLLVDNVDSETLSNVELPDDTRLKIVDAAKSVANQNIGFGSIYSIYMAVEELLPSLAAEVGSGTVKAIETPSNESSSNENEEEIDIGSTSLTDQVVSEVEEEKMIIEATTEAAKSYKNNGNKPVNNGKKPGVYSVVVGLVGKPNAGKSTFFNCVTRAAMELDSRRQAQVGAYPFTTIEPNFGVGLFRPEWSEAAVDSSQTKDQKTSATASSSSSSATMSSEYKSGSSAESNTNRLLPILVKDVAGLVPGAWKGLGKGNKFLNDLLDADILVHVCDASGKSNANGVIVGPNMGGTTVKEDAQWIRLEIHRWIAANVISKWDSVSKWRRKSSSTRTSKQFEGDKIQSRVCSLFTGYHCRAQFVHAAAEFAGLNLATADQWRREDVHRLVAFFISYRFPIFLALNKIDTIGRELSTGDSETAKTFIDEKILEEALYTAKENGDCALPVSGGVESFLLQSSAQNLIDYEIGSATFALLDEGKKKYSTDKKFKEEVDIAKFVMDKYHGTGVLNAISYAVKLCFPIYVFPIPPNTGTGLNPHLISRQFLSDCIIVTPGTSMEEVYEILHRGSVTTCSFRLDGDLVRIEAKSLQEVYSDADCTIPWHQLSKDVLVNSSNAVVRIFTNRKVAWQQQLGATGKDKSNTNGKR